MTAGRRPTLRRLLARGCASVAVAGMIVLSQPPVTAQDAPIIHIAVPPLAAVAPLLYAQKAGLFASAGLNVDIQTLNSGAAIAAGVAGGAIQIGSGSLQAVIAAHANGVPLVLIAPGGIYHADVPYAYLIVRKDSSIRSARDFTGKTIASSSLRDLDYVASAAWIDQNGGDSSTVHFVEVPTPAQLPALLDRRIDGYTVGQLWITVALRSPNVRAVAKSFSAIAPRFLMTAYFSTSDYVAANGAAMATFARVIATATRYANANPAKMAPLVAALTKQDPSVVAGSLGNLNAVDLDPKLIQPMIDASARYRVIAKPFPAAEILILPTAQPAR